MDVLAHVLWTNAVFHYKYHRQRRMRYLAAFFGVLPDLVSFVPVFFFVLYSGLEVSKKIFTEPSHHWTFLYAAESYKYTHSFVIFFAVVLVVTIIGNIYLRRKSKVGAQASATGKLWFYWPLLGWALHILIDMPSHKSFYETPIFFPLSNVKFEHGVPWSNPIYMVINYASLALVYIGLALWQRNSRKKLLKIKNA